MRSDARNPDRRVIGVRRMLEGYPTDEVADFLDVDLRTVWRWWSRFQEDGWEGLTAQTGGGRPPKLTGTQTKIVVRWLRDDPSEHGFSTDLWTAARIGQLIRKEWGIAFHPHYLSSWMRKHGLSPQKPQRVPRERDPEAIAAWLAKDWPRIKKKRTDRTPASHSSTKAAF
jgi:transposase